jgi:hypothetical protein
MGTDQKYLTSLNNLSPELVFPTPFVILTVASAGDNLALKQFNRFNGFSPSLNF